MKRKPRYTRLLKSFTMDASVQIYSPTTDLVSNFWRTKYDKDAKKYWDLFYKRNSDKFFKDRHYLHKEWGHYLQKVAPSAATNLHDGPSSEQLVVLEVGCGVGNTLFPLLDTYPDLFIHACDFSPRAVNLLKAHKKYTENHLHAFVCDVTLDDLTLCVPAQSVDVATLVFTLSSISPEKMPKVLQNIKKVLKPRGHVLLRDYAYGDLAQERLSTKVQKISPNFYVRGDGTRAYYFTEPGLLDLFKAEGYVCDTLKVFEKRVENRARGISMDRRWVQGVFCLLNGLGGDESQLSLTGSRSPNSDEPNSDFDLRSSEADLSQDIAMFGIPELEVMAVAIDEHLFQIKTIPNEFQHCCQATGLMLWESALVLATLIARNGDTFSCKAILELGCGSVGICSMVASMVANIVVATDGDSDALALLKENVRANSQKFTSKTLCIEMLNWGCLEQIGVVKQQTGGNGYDIILGSDVTYVAETVPLFFATARSLIASTQPQKMEPVLLLCHIERNVNEEFILSAAQECGFSLQGKWPPHEVDSQATELASVVKSLFPHGLEEAFSSHPLVHLFCFRQTIPKGEISGQAVLNDLPTKES